MTVGLILGTFQTMFPEFSNVSTALIQTFIDLINNGYQFTQQSVSDPVVLNVYYWLLAHLVATATQPVTGVIGGPAGSYLPGGTTAGLVSATFQQVENLCADQSFMLSTRYGQVYWTFAKQQYVQNFYLNGGLW